MRMTECRDSFRYNLWANEQTFDAVSRLAPEAFTRDLGTSHVSVRETLQHILAAEWIWLRRWLGESPTAMPAFLENRGLDELRAGWRAIAEPQMAFVTGLDEARLDEVIHYRNLKGEPRAHALWQLLRHLVNHSSYHRGQVTAMLRQLGAVPIPTDMVRFFDV
jgi:uncharacterized damage-inducible protein DinB